jgi:hypothetical protein
VTWDPPADVRAAGERIRGRVPNVQGSQLVSDTETIQRPIEPGTQALREYIAQRWGVVVGAARGGRARRPARREDGTLRRRDVHEEGRALDVMTERDTAKGSEIANWLATRALELGIQYLIFDELELSSSTIGPAWEPYTTSGDRGAMGRARDPHRDHVHVELTPASARDGATMRQVLGMPARSLTSSGSSTTSGLSTGPNTRVPPVTNPSRMGESIERTRVFSGPRPFESWARDRFPLLYLLVGDSGVLPANALHTARAVLALCISETGWQRTREQGEYNYNGANITGESPYGYTRIAGNPRRFRAYPSAREGYGDLVRVLSTRHYRAAWDRLVLGGDAVAWYDSILRAGYTGWSDELVQGYRSVLERIPREYTRRR